MCFSPCLLLTGKAKNPGAKAQICVGPLMARLKSCPDTKHYRGENRKIHAFLSRAAYCGFVYVFFCGS
jgi:hypothetical protein